MNRTVKRFRTRPRRGYSNVSTSVGISNGFHYAIYDADGKHLCDLDARNMSDALKLAKAAGLPADTAVKTPCACT